MDAGKCLGGPAARVISQLPLSTTALRGMRIQVVHHQGDGVGLRITGGDVQHVGTDSRLGLFSERGVFMGGPSIGYLCF